MFVLVFIVAPLLELLFSIEMAHVIGWPAIVIETIVAMVAGAVVIRHVGVSAFRRARRVLREGSRPAEEIVDVILVFAAGVLLFIPGLLSDVVAVGLLVSPLRRAVGGRILHRVRVRRQIAAARPARHGPGQRVVDVGSRDHDLG
jgi:UPF0716 protein FxsA